MSADEMPTEGRKMVSSLEEEESLTTRKTSCASEQTSDTVDLPETVQTVMDYKDISSNTWQQ